MNEMKRPLKKKEELKKFETRNNNYENKRYLL